MLTYDVYSVNPWTVSRPGSDMTGPFSWQGALLTHSLASPLSHHQDLASPLSLTPRILAFTPPPHHPSLLLYRWVFFQGNFASRQFFSRFSDIQGAKFASFCRTMVCFCNISVKFPISQNFRRKPTYNHYDHLTYCSMVLPLNWVHLISLSVTMNAIMQNAHMSVARNFTKWQIADCAFYVSFILQIVVFVMMDILVEPSSVHCTVLWFTGCLFSEAAAVECRCPLSPRRGCWAGLVS